MPLTRTEARDEILALLKAATDAIPALASNVVYDDTRKEVPDGSPAPTWARAAVEHTTSRQSTLSDSTKRFTRQGLLTVQVFAPLGGGEVTSDAIADAIMAAYEGVSTPNGVWFRNVRAVEVGADGPWFHTNVFVEFEYDSLR